MINVQSASFQPLNDSHTLFAHAFIRLGLGSSLQTTAEGSRNGTWSIPVIRRLVTSGPISVSEDMISRGSPNS